MSYIKSIIAMSVLALTTIGVITYGVTRSTPAIAAEKAQIWEYKAIAFLMPVKRRSIEPELNKLGMEGWELVSAIEDQERYFRLILKRPK